MATTRIIITMTTITNQTQSSIGVGFHYQQGLRGWGSFLFLVVIFGCTHKKINKIIVISTIVASKRNKGQWVELETSLLIFSSSSKPS
jgi:hypothetical protein